MTAPAPGFSLADGWDLSGLSRHQLWLRCIGLGGNASAAEIAAFVWGQEQPSSYQHNIIAQALNEYFSERGEDHPVAYSDIPRFP
jgi:hypothetical protein